MGHNRARAQSLVEQLIRLGRPFRARDVAEHGVNPTSLRYVVLPQITQLERGVYGARQTEYPRIAIALVRVSRSFACLSSALWLHGLLPEEPPEAWVCIHHKAWKPTALPGVPTRIVRTSVWPQREDIAFTATGLPMTSLPRTVIDCFRYNRLMAACAGPEALWLALESGKCTIEEIEACAARCRVRWVRTRPGASRTGASP